MSNESTNKTALVAFTVRKYKVGKDERQEWTRIGRAFQHKDSEGYDIVLQALPVDGRVVLRKPLPKDGADGAESPEA